MFRGKYFSYFWRDFCTKTDQVFHLRSRTASGSKTIVFFCCFFISQALDAADIWTRIFFNYIRYLFINLFDKQKWWRFISFFLFCFVTIRPQFETHTCSPSDGYSILTPLTKTRSCRSLRFICSCEKSLQRKQNQAIPPATVHNITIHYWLIIELTSSAFTSSFASWYCKYCQVTCPGNPVR